MAHIFVVDDDEQLLRMVGLMLERGGHKATLISHPSEALERLLAEPPDMAILDVMMPGMSGHDLCRQLRVHDQTENLPVLILTARAQEVDRQVALQSGADDYLSKPVTSQELLRHVDKLLTEKSTTDKNKPPCFVIAVYGFHGGVGRTTLATNLAIALRETSKQEVCLVDFSVSGGQAAMHLRLTSQAGWADLLTSGTLEWRNIQHTLLTHETGLKLLPAPTVPQPPTQPTTEMTQALLGHLREHMQFVVVDLPPMLSASVKGTLAMSDLGLHVLMPDVIAVQTAVRTDRVVSSMGLTPKERSHILNHREGQSALARAIVERGLNARIPLEIGYDRNQVRALAQGTPLMTSGGTPSPLSASLRVMAEALWQKVLAQVGG